MQSTRIMKSIERSKRVGGIFHVRRVSKGCSPLKRGRGLRGPRAERQKEGGRESPAQMQRDGERGTPKPQTRVGQAEMGAVTGS